MIGGRQASDSIRWRAKVCRRTGGSNTGSASTSAISCRKAC